MTIYLSKNISLQESLERLIEKVITTITIVQDQHIPPYMDKKYSKHFLDNENPIKNPRLQTDKPLSDRLFEEFLIEEKPQIKALQEYKNCIMAIKSSNALKNKNKIGDYWGQQFEDEFDLLLSSIWKIVKASYEEGSFNRSKLTEEYKKLKTYFYDENTTIVQILIPFFNLESDCTNIDFGQLIDSVGKATLRSMTDADKTFLIAAYGGYSSERTFAIHRSVFLLEIECYDKFYSIGENLHKKIKVQIQNLVTALRLLKKGYVGAPFILFKHPLSDNSMTIIPLDYDVSSLWPSANQGEVLFPYSFTISRDEVDLIVSILQLLKQPINKNNDLPIRRFNSAYEKTNKADKFLDLMITYEAIFSGKQSDSISHKLAWRFSRLLGNSSNQQRDLFNDMKKVYGERSKLVHGSGDEIPQVWLEKAEEYMRSSIKEYLKLMNINSFTNNDQFIDFIDFIKGAK